MSNSITLVGTTFTNTTGDEPTHGFRMYDDYDAAYCNLMSKEEANATDENLLRLASNEYSDDSITQMVDFGLEHGMLINNTWYAGEEIAAMLEG